MPVWTPSNETSSVNWRGDTALLTSWFSSGSRKPCGATHGPCRRRTGRPRRGGSEGLWTSLWLMVRVTIRSGESWNNLPDGPGMIQYDVNLIIGKRPFQRTQSRESATSWFVVERPALHRWLCATRITDRRWPDFSGFVRAMHCQAVTQGLQPDPDDETRGRTRPPGS